MFSLVLITLAFIIALPGLGAVPFIGLCGLAQAGVFPSLLGRAGRLYSNTPGTALGLIATGTGLGSMVIAWLISLVSQLAGLHAGFAFLELAYLLCVALMIYHIRRLRERTMRDTGPSREKQDGGSNSMRNAAKPRLRRHGCGRS